ncbi:MAG: hypothetical protein DRJ37_00320 [Thermoprotei archaeon]|nr:MAG: hypothetical protein DRJ37_00320 [Thermoprotei archaeon]
MKVSIVVATRNCEKHVRDLMESLAKIVNEDIEVIVVDSSEDATPCIVSEYSFVKLVKLNKLGLNVARNRGVKEATGDVIIFTDCDCIVPEEWVKNILEVFKRENAHVVGGSALNFYKGESLIMDYANEGIWSIMPVYREKIVFDRDSFKKTRLPPGNNLSFKREIFDKGYFFDEEYRGGSDEVDLLWRLCRDGFKIVVDPSVYVYHKHRTSLLELFKQEFRYGMGHYIFFKKNKDSPLAWPAAIGSYVFALFLTALLVSYFISTIAFLLIGLFLSIIALEVYVVLFLYYFKKRKMPLKRSVLYPVLDIVCHALYLFGFLYSNVKDVIRRIAYKAR